MRLPAVTDVRLKRALSLHGIPSRPNEPSMLADLPTTVLQSASFSGLEFQPFDGRLVSPQSFPHLWKKLWKFHRNRDDASFQA